MKLISIRIKNIHSLKGEHFIDFTESPLQEAGLFAITGPTGSGKSSIIDALCLALYNEIPRLGKITKTVIQEKGAVITRNTTEALAEVKYATADGIFVSTWTIAYNRNNNLNDYEMKLARFDSGEYFDLKKSEVPAKNTELIGLNFDQFLRSVVLAQGDFAQFLKSGHKERTELLEKLTGGEIYRELSIFCRRYYESKKRELKEKENQLAGIPLLSEEQRLEIRKKILQLKAELETLRAEEEKVRWLQNQNQEYLNLKQEAERLNQSWQALSQKKSEAETWSEKLNRHRQAAPLQQQLMELKHRREQIQKQESEKKRQQQEAEQLGNAIRQQQEVLENLNPKNLPVEAWFEETRQKLQDLNQKIIEVRTTLHYNNQELQQFENKAKNPTQLKAMSIEQIQVQLQRIETECANNFHTQLGEEELEEQLNKQAYTLEEIQRIETQIREREQQITELEKLRQKAESLDFEIKIKGKELQQMLVEIAEKKQLLELLKQKMPHADVANLRASLEPGQPCPVCGSIEHPSALEQLPDAGEIKELEAQIRKLEIQVAGGNAEQTTLKKQWTGLRLEIEQKRESQKSQPPLPDKTALETQKQEAVKVKSEIEKARELNRNRQKLQKYLSLRQTDNILREQLEMLEIQIREICPEPEPLNWVQNQSRIWETNRIRQESINKQIEAISKQMEAEELSLKQLEININAELNRRGFSGLQELEQALLTPEHQEQLERDLSEYEKNCAVVQNNLTNNQKQLEQISPEAAQADAAVIKQRRLELQKLQEEKQRELAVQGKLLELDDEWKQKAEGLSLALKNLQKENERWERLDAMIGSASGDNFSKKVQALHMERLLWLANNRLEKMSPRYRFSIGQSGDDELYVEDLYQGSTQRAASTLSGGEMFLASLALALALADMASGNRHTSFMFIDEGFGTLDPETLELALDTLEKLQSETNRNVGIISHVQGLKDRIFTQIQVIPDGQGHSVVKISRAG